MKDRMKRWTAVLITVGITVFLLSSSLIACAVDDDAYDGYAADDLTIKVGYMGGPYYTKKVFTLEEIEAMESVKDSYTFIDNMPSVIIDHAKGVRLSDLMDAAGIDMGSIQNFYFYTVDKQTGGYFTDFTKTELIDTVRYCYYSLPDNFDEETGMGNEDSTSIAEPVDTIISYADDWRRVIEGADFNDSDNLNTATRFRLIFGQVDAVTRTANRSAKWIHEIDVQLGGSPTLTTSDPSVLDLKLGSQKTLSVSIRNADDAIESDSSLIQWSSDNESAVTVDQNGTITVVGEGTARITAAFGDSRVSFTVNGSKEEETDGGDDQNKDGDNTDSQDEGLPADDERNDDSPEPDEPDEPEAEAEENRDQPQEIQIYGGAGSGAGTSSGSSSGGKGGTRIAGSVNSQAGTGASGSSSPEKAKEKKNDSSGKSVMGEVTLDDSGGDPASSSEVLPDSMLESPEAPDGGVQNWRVYEMSENAAELPEIQMDNPLLGFTKVMLAVVFIGGGAAEIIWFNLRAGRRRVRAVNLPMRGTGG